MKIYTATSTITTAMQDLIRSVASEFKHELTEMNCDDWEEFMFVNGFDSSDVKEEIRYYVDEMYNGALIGSDVIAEDDSIMSYREFKKRVLAELK